MDLGNSIALLAAGLAIIGTLYSNHQNSIRSREQLNFNKKQLNKQLIFSKRSDALVTVGELFLKHTNSDKEYHPKDPEDREARHAPRKLCEGLKKIRNNLNEFYYLPKNLKKAIQDFDEYTKDEYISCIPKNSTQQISTDNELEKHFETIYSCLQRNLEKLEKSDE